MFGRSGRMFRDVGIVFEMLLVVMQCLDTVLNVFSVLKCFEYCASVLSCF
jgi:hypothetical protein